MSYHQMQHERLVCHDRELLRRLFLRSRMRARGDVLHLPGRLPRCGERLTAADATGTPHPRPRQSCSTNLRQLLDLNAQPAQSFKLAPRCNLPFPAVLTQVETFAGTARPIGWVGKMAVLQNRQFQSTYPESDRQIYMNRRAYTSWCKRVEIQLSTPLSLARFERDNRNGEQVTSDIFLVNSSTCCQPGKERQRAINIIHDGTPS